MAKSFFATGHRQRRLFEDTLILGIVAEHQSWIQHLFQTRSGCKYSGNNDPTKHALSVWCLPNGTNVSSPPVHPAHSPYLKLKDHHCWFQRTMLRRKATGGPSSETYRISYRLRPFTTATPKACNEPKTSNRLTSSKGKTSIGRTFSAMSIFDVTLTY